jgi:threonine/homoserine/homoserine lactone efflux protein
MDALLPGFTAGFVGGGVLMIAVGPIALLLVDTGLGRGFRSGWTAGLGVALADLTFAVGALTVGTLALEHIRSVQGWLEVVGAVILVGVGAMQFRHAFRPASATPAVAASTAAGGRLTLRFFLLTAINPLTILAFTSLVVAGGVERGSWAWPVGVATASVLVHLSLVGVGSSLGAVFGARAQRGLRVVGAVSIIGLAAVVVFR